jgi:hypothetical protein
MSKQDGYSSRTAVDLERKYNFGKTFAEVYDLCSEAQRAAQEASNAVDSLTPEEIFNRLTNYGDWQGIYRGDDDNIYINAEFIKGGVIKAGQVEVEAASITGELEATQINAKDLKVLAANIIGTLTAGQIDTTYLKVYAANIDGLLSADQIDVDSIVASALQGSYINFYTEGDGELGYIELNNYDQKDTVNLYSYETVWVKGDYEAILMCGDFDEYVSVTKDGVFASSPVAETSDRKKKKDITYGLGNLDGFFDDLKPADYRFVNGKSGRRHRGFVAQDIKASLEKHGISTQDFAGYVEKKDRDGGTTAGLRYSEFIALLVDQVQKLKARVAELEEKTA